MLVGAFEDHEVSVRRETRSCRLEERGACEKE